MADSFTLPDLEPAGDLTGVGPLSTPQNGEDRRVTIDQFTAYILRQADIVIANVIDDYNPSTGTGTDNTAIILAAKARLPASGGTIRIPNGRRFLVEGSLPLGKNVLLECNNRRIDSRVGADLSAFGSTMYLNPAATITIDSSAAVIGLAIFAKGWVPGISSAQIAATFAGSAITIADAASGATCERLTIAGFAYGIRTVASNFRADRVNVRNCLIDCLNGVRLDNAAESSIIENVRCWPLTSLGNIGEAGSPHLKRSGESFYYGGSINDWSMISRCFSYGYYRGYHIGSAASVTIDNCGADHVPGSADGSIGFLLDGNCREARLIAPQTAGKDYGIFVNSSYNEDNPTTPRLTVTIEAPNVWTTTTAAIYCPKGDVQINGGSLRNVGGVGSGVTTGQDSGRVDVIGTNFRGFATALDNYSSTTQLRYHLCTFNSNAVQIANAYLPSLASAASIVPNGEDQFYRLTGSVTVTTISSPQRYTGRTLKFLVVNGTTFNPAVNIRTKSAGNVAVPAGTMFAVTSDGTNWFET